MSMKQHDFETEPFCLAIRAAMKFESRRAAAVMTVTAARAQGVRCKTQLQRSTPFTCQMMSLSIEQVIQLTVNCTTIQERFIFLCKCFTQKYKTVKTITKLERQRSNLAA